MRKGKDLEPDPNQYLWIRIREAQKHADPADPNTGLERPLRDRLEIFYYNIHVTTIFVCWYTMGPLLLLI